MKKIIILATAVLLSLLAGCAGSKEAGSVTVSVKTQEKELYSFAVKITEEDTALSVIQKAGKDNQIVVSVQSDYLTSIGGLAAGDQGDMSGWVFRVNGAFGSVGAGDTPVKSGDAVEWLYSLDYGEDWGFSF